MMNDLLTFVYRKDYIRLTAIFRAEDCINSKDGDGRTPLMHAVLAEDADVDFVKFLISEGADVNARDKSQAWTALHFAARDQKLPIVEVLLDAKAEIDPQDTFGNTPLWRAVMSGSSQKVIELLVSRGANSELQNKSGVSALDIAQRKSKFDIEQSMRKVKGQPTG
jgi:ankyrin repeat protein